MGYFDYDYTPNELKNEWYRMWKQEHFMEGCYVLGIPIFLTFAILLKFNSKQYEGNKLKFSFAESRDQIQAKIMNCGIPIVHYSFDKSEFDDFVSQNPNLITPTTDDTYTVDLNVCMNNWDSLNGEIQKLCKHNPDNLKRFKLVDYMLYLSVLSISDSVLDKFGLGFIT